MFNLACALRSGVFGRKSVFDFHIPWLDQRFWESYPGKRIKTIFSFRICQFRHFSDLSFRLSLFSFWFVSLLLHLSLVLLRNRVYFRGIEFGGSDSISLQDTLMAINSSQNGSQTAGKTIIRRRSWTDTEERVLIDAFKEILSQGWKTENGFRNGFLGQLEQKMKAALPGTDLRGHPHINSKYNTWKRQFREVRTCLNLSGFNWDENTKKSHPSLKDVKDRRYPFYNTWFDMFADDTAIGAASKDTQNCRKRAQSQPPPNTNLYDDDGLYGASPDTETPDNYSPSEAGTPGAAPPKAGTPHAKETKKRKKIDGIEELSNCIMKAWGKAMVFGFRVNEFPRIGFRVSHLQERFAFKEKRYKTWVAIIEHDGVWFDESLMSVKADEETWDAICQKQPLAAVYRTTQYEELWPELCGIFGHDDVRIRRNALITPIKGPKSPRRGKKDKEPAQEDMESEDTDDKSYDIENKEEVHGDGGLNIGYNLFKLGETLMNPIDLTKASPATRKNPKRKCGAKRFLDF